MTLFLSAHKRNGIINEWLRTVALLLVVLGSVISLITLPVWVRPSDASSLSADFDQGKNKSSSCLPALQTTNDLMPDPAIVCGQLNNGFGYLLLQNNHPLDRVSVHLYVRAGSLNENAAQQGLAHFLEHMQFNGSDHFPPGKLVRYFQSIGMQFGNDANAHTGFDETVYDIILPTGDEENLKNGLLVMRDYAMGAALSEKEIKRESGVILAEMRSRDSAAYRTLKATLQFELPHFLVSERLPIGKADIIRNADRALLKAFYDTWYRPDNMVLIMVGDFDIPMAQSLIEAQFKDFIPRAPRSAPPELGTIDHQGIDVFYHHEPETGGTTVSIEMVRPHHPQPDSLSRRRQEILADMADRIVQNRLDSIQKLPIAPFTATTVGSGVYLNHIRYAEISADCNPEHWQPTLAVLEQELRRARLFGFSPAELERVKKEMFKMLENAVKEAPTRNSTQLARSIIRKLSDGRVIQSPLQEKNNLAPIISSATSADVHQAFLDNWPDEHRLVLVTGNANLKKRATQTPAVQIRNTFLSAANMTVHPPESEATVTFPYLPEPDDTGAIASREVIEDLGITCIRFANGVRLNLKHTDYKTNEVLANLMFGQGRSQEPAVFPGLALLAEATVNESGLGAMDTNELERALAGTSTSVDFSIAEGYFSFAVKSVPSEMALLFQLFYAHLTDPGFRDDALRLARERLDQHYQSLSRSIEGMLRIEGLRILAGGDTRFGAPTAKDLQAIDLDAIRGWLAPELASAPLELSIVGDFDENEVIALARRYLGGLADRNHPPQSLRTDLPHLPVGTTHHIDVDTQIDKAMLIVAWPTEDFWNIQRTRRLSVLADIFSERLREQVREKLGASYSPYAFNQGSRAYAGYGTFQAHVNVAPNQVDTVLTEVKAIAKDLVDRGITDDERIRALDPILTSIKEYRRTNEYWLNSVITGSNRAPQQLEWARSFIQDYSAITKTELSDLADRYLSDERSAVLVIQPRTGK